LDPQKISKPLTDIFLSDTNQIYYSPISLWEISLKYGKGKLIFDGFTPEDFFSVIQESKLLCSPISNEDFVLNYTLPRYHFDPFDRLICWHAIQNTYTLVSVDKKIHLYEASGLRVYHE
jgi:PIN domain nuclease of toxin-antitoxin system